MSRVGDVWILGDHRLVCGDSRDPVVVEKAMAGARAALMNTDSPYGVSFNSTKDGIPRSGFRNQMERFGGEIDGDTLDGDALQVFLEAVFRVAVEVALRENAAWYLWHAHLTQGFFAAAAAAANIVRHRQIIWYKPHLVLTRSGMYHWQHELSFYGWVQGHPPPWYGERNQTTVWQVDYDPERHHHPTQKPVELFRRPILNHTKKGESIYEPFAGSGSQIIAAEQLERRCHAIEIDPRHVDLCVSRWESTQECNQRKKAVHEESGLGIEELRRSRSTGDGDDARERLGELDSPPAEPIP